MYRAVVVGQLVEWLLPISEVRGSNPVIGINLYIENLFIYCQLCWKDENKEKEAGYGPIFLITVYLGSLNLSKKLPFRDTFFVIGSSNWNFIEELPQLRTKISLEKFRNWKTLQNILAVKKIQKWISFQNYFLALFSTSFTCGCVWK